MKSHQTKRREAWQLIAWVGAVVTGLLILYCRRNGATHDRFSCLAGVVLASWLAWRQRWKDEAGLCCGVSRTGRSVSGLVMRCFGSGEGVD